MHDFQEDSYGSRGYVEVSAEDGPLRHGRCAARVRASASRAHRVRVQRGRVRAACEHRLDDMDQLRAKLVENGDCETMIMVIMIMTISM